jgi:peptide/nickel transport system ATP-binding protein
MTMAMTPEDELLRIDGLHTQIKQRHGVVHAVDGISLTVRRGETVGLVGESGSGKTMTGMSIMGLLPPGGRIVGGSIRLGHRDLVKLSARDLRQVRGYEVAMVFQDPMTSLNPCMTIGRQIAEVVTTKWHASKQAASDRAAEMLDLVGVPRPRERLSDYPHQLSGGLRQRVMIAIALACEPKLLIADEPTTALDVTIQAQILALLDDLKERLGMGMLLITHDMGVIAGRADRTVVMYGGRVVEAAPTPKLFAQPRHPYTEALLESIPALHDDRSRVLYTIPGLPPDLVDPEPGCRFAPRCRHATSQCLTEDPALGGEDPEHAYACFNPVHVAPARQRWSAAVAAASAERDQTGEDGRTPLLVVDDVVKRYPVTAGVLQKRVGWVHAVSGVSLSIADGETFGLVGESGCGKTTLGRMVTALERPDAGSISFLGSDLATMREPDLRLQRRDFQLMFQDPYASLDPRMRVRSTVREPLAVHGIGSRSQQHERVDELLHEVGLAPRSADLYPHEFSGGQRQRVGLARALALNPKLIVADEPVSALDVSIRSQILNLMKRLQATHHLSYLVISHDLSVVHYLADRVGVMYLGKMVEIGASEEIFARPAHPYTRGLLDAIPSEARAAERPAVRGEMPSPLSPPPGCRFHTRCPWAQEICTTDEPVLRSVGTGDHQVACHFPLTAPEGVAKPEPGSVLRRETVVDRRPSTWGN